MFENRREIMQDVFLTYLPAQHFKTSRLTLNLVTGLDRASASANALLPAVLRRGKNASKATVAKHATVQEYRASTGFECLLGWLYLTGQMPRVEELFEKLWADFDPNQK